MIPYKPRWLNWLYAELLGYFWIPCPLCGEKFGAHEWTETLWDDEYITGQGVCRKCAPEAARRNERLLGAVITTRARRS